MMNLVENALFKQNPWTYTTWLVSVAAVVALLACGGGDSDGNQAADASPSVDAAPPVDAGPTPTPPQGSSLTLRIINLDDNPVDQGHITYTPGQNQIPIHGGVVVLEDLEPGVELNYDIVVDGYVRQTGQFTPREGENKPGRPVRLRPRNPEQTFANDQEATVRDTEMMPTAQITVPADSLEYVESGNPVQDDVTVTITPLDVTKLDADSVPAPLRGIGREGEEQLFATLAMVEITLTQGGRTVQPRPGQSITVELLLDDETASQPGVEPGATFELWYKEKGENDWKQEVDTMSMAVLATVIDSTFQPGKEAVQFSVTHFTWWSVGATVVQAHCFEVTVVDMDGNPVSDMFVSANGVRSMGTFTVDQTVNGCLDTVEGGTVDLVVGPSNAPVAEILRRTATGPAASCTTNRTACIPVELQLNTAIVCTPGDYFACDYTGPEDTENIGRCRAARQYCNTTGTAREACTGEVVPAMQECKTVEDETCGVSAMDMACADLTMFTDSALRDCVNSEISAAPDATMLFCNDYGISDITGIEQFSSLDLLVLANNEIMDLSPLSTLTALTSLDVGSNNITNIAPLSSLTALTSLSVDRNNITDITPLSSLTALEFLDMQFNSVSALMPLSGLSSLDHLRAQANDISDLSPLSSLPVLRILSLGGNPNIVDVTPLQGVSSLQFLFLDPVGVSDVTPLASLTGLRRLILVGSNVTTGVALLVSLVNIMPPNTLDLRGNTTMPCADLQTLQASPLSSVVLPTTSIDGVDCTN